MNCAVKIVIRSGAREHVNVDVNGEGTSLKIKIMAKCVSNILGMLEKVFKKIAISKIDAITINWGQTFADAAVTAAIEKLFDSKVMSFHDPVDALVDFVYKRVKCRGHAPDFASLGDPKYKDKIINYVQNMCGRKISREVAETIADKVSKMLANN